VARSQYIWVVQADRSKNVIAAFTVKHELLSWIGRELAESEQPRRVLMVTRYRDGSASGFVRLGSARELLEAAR
jgi:hypothetical protein